MPFPAPGNPNPYPPWPPPQAGQFPGGNWLMQQWGRALQQTPWNVQPGFQNVPHQYPVNPFVGGGMLAQPVADIYSFTKKGLLGVPGTEGAGGRGLGSRGGGLLGGRYNFRDPQSVAQYELDQGIKPGSLQPVAPRSAEVREIPAVNTPANRARVPSQAELDANFKRLGYEKPGPTPAQMARPVKQTPEISAKLAEARANRARTRAELEKSSSDMLAKRPFRNMTHDLWGKMSAADRSAWLRDANWKSWPVEHQRTFMERFMPKGIGP